MDYIVVAGRVKQGLAAPALVTVTYVLGHIPMCRLLLNAGSAWQIQHFHIVMSKILPQHNTIHYFVLDTP